MLQTALDHKSPLFRSISESKAVTAKLGSLAKLEWRKFYKGIDTPHPKRKIIILINTWDGLSGQDL